MRIVVMGAGGVGGYFGGVLAKAGHEVSFIARGRHLEAMKERGLQVRGFAGEFSIPVRASETPAEVGPVDLVLFCVKTYETDEAVKAIVPAIADATVVLPLQNGVESAERIGDVIGPEKLLGGLAYIESFVARPGVIEQRSEIRRIELGELDGSETERARAVASTLDGAGIDCRLRSDIRKALWEKLIWIASGSGMTAVTRSTIGEVLGCSPTREMFIAAAREVDAVARASGVGIDGEAVARVVRFAEGLSPSSKTSMLRDVENGNRLEIDALNGAVVRIGARVSVRTPVNEFIYDVLKLEDEKNYRRSQTSVR